MPKIEPLNTGIHKYCATCDSMVLTELFSKRAASKDGLHVRCKQCDSKYYHKNKNNPIPREPTVPRKLHDALKISNNELRLKSKAQQKRIAELKDEILKLQKRLIK